MTIDKPATYEKPRAVGVQVDPFISTATCPDCGVPPGKTHLDNCSIERCPECGGQRLFDDCEETMQRLCWTGEFPGKYECREFGWYSRMIHGKLGWHSCKKSDAGATENLNRLHVDAIWNKNKGRYVL